MHVQLKWAYPGNYDNTWAYILKLKSKKRWLQKIEPMLKTLGCKVNIALYTCVCAEENYLKNLSVALNLINYNAFIWYHAYGVFVCIIWENNDITDSYLGVNEHNNLLESEYDSTSWVHFKFRGRTGFGVNYWSA